MAKEEREWVARVEITLPGVDSCGFDHYLEYVGNDEVEADQEAWNYLAEQFGDELFKALQSYLEIRVESF